MKKRAICFLFILLTLLVACERTNVNSHPSGTSDTVISDTEHSRQEDISQETESEVIEDISLPPEVSDSDYLVHIDGRYASFEDIVLLCDEIAVGKLLYAHPAYEEVIFAFSISRWIHGERQDKTIYLHESRAYMAFGGYTYRGGEIPFEQGKEYLLILCSEERENTDHTYYSTFGNMYIPTDDLSQAKMYNDEFKNHTEKPELFSADAGEDALNGLVEYVVSLKQ